MRTCLPKVFALALAFTVAGCAAPRPVPTVAPQPEQPAAPAAESGAITVYTALEDDQLQRYLPLFNQKHPKITVNIVRDSTGIITAKLLAEKDNPQADVVWGLAATSLLVADQQGMLEPYAPRGLDKITPQFRDSANPPKWVGIDAWFTAFCVNTVELAAKNLPMPTSWEDLLNPAFKGHIVMPHPSSSGTGFLSVSGLLQLKGADAGWEYLDKLHENIAQYLHSGSKPCRMAGAGEAIVGISFDYRAIKQKESGEPLEAVFPTEGSGWDIEANALVKKASIKPAAKLFLDWALSEEIMKEYATSFPVTAAPSGLPIPAGYPADPLKQLIPYDLTKAAAERDDILKLWTEKYDGKSAPK